MNNSPTCECPNCGDVAPIGDWVRWYCRCGITSIYRPSGGGITEADWEHIAKASCIIPAAKEDTDEQ